MSTTKNRNKSNNTKNNSSVSGTGKNTAMLGLPTKSTSSLENSKNQNTKNKFINNSNQTINIMTKSLPELLKETEEMEVKLATINSEMDKERNLLTQENLELNTEITDRGFEISCLSTENKNLISQLKDIKTSLDDKMKLSKIFLAKTEQLKKNEKNLKKKIDVLEKEIVLAKKNNQITQKDCNKFKNLLKNNEEGKEKILDEELKNLQQMKLELENNNINLRKVIKEHKLCPKIKTNLLSKLNMLKNSYEFEQKKTNMLETNLIDLGKKKEKIKQEIKEKEEFNANNRSISYCTNLRKDVLKQMEKKNSENKRVNSNARLHIYEICNSIEEQNVKNSGNIKRISGLKNQSEPKVLFTETEQIKLASIIPPSFLNEFKERFEQVENQRYDLFNKLKMNKNKFNDQSSDIQIKLNYTELKKKEQKMQWVGMNSNLSGEYAQFDCKPYEQCLSGIAVTHSPRYLIDMNVDETIFEKINIPYDTFRTLKESEKINRVRHYYIDKARSEGKVEMPWWMGGSTEVNISMYNDQSIQRKEMIKKQMFILFPELLYGNTSEGYKKAAFWLCNRYSLLCYNMRDTFSAGGQTKTINGVRLANPYPGVVGRILTYRKDIEAMLKHPTIQLYEDICEYWDFDYDEINLYESWIDIVEKQFSISNINIRKHIENYDLP